MRTRERGQGDLFARGMATVELQANVRAKLVPLLRSLLAEAAGASRSVAEADAGGREGGDDQDHP